MAKTFVELQTALGEWLAKDVNQISLAIRKDIINAARRSICSEGGWSFCEKPGTVTIPTGQRSGALPSDFISIRLASYVSAAGGVVILGQMFPNEQAGEYGLDADAGEPESFSTWARYLTIECPAESDLVVNIEYYAFLPDLVADDEHDYLTDTHWPMLLFASLSFASAYGFEDERAPAWQAAYRMEKDKARSTDNAQRSSSAYLDTNEPGGVGSGGSSIE
jgi:hypothetical protein